MLLRATLIAAAIALLSFAALAHADAGNESQYVSDVRALGVVENLHGILADGYTDYTDWNVRTRPAMSQTPPR
ncbi:MAG TPA: hypothetical protein VMC78_22005 [Mycobacterium sp.]|nr:hypothetical protein [Mycobacterium sp.]